MHIKWKPLRWCQHPHIQICFGRRKQYKHVTSAMFYEYFMKTYAHILWQWKWCMKRSFHLFPGGVFMRMWSDLWFVCPSCYCGCLCNIKVRVGSRKEWYFVCRTAPLGDIRRMLRVSVHVWKRLRNCQQLQQRDFPPLKYWDGFSLIAILGPRR